MIDEFTPEEMEVLKAFYARERAASIRSRTGIDPWPIVARHRNLPPERYEVIRELLQ